MPDRPLFHEELWTLNRNITLSSEDLEKKCAPPENLYSVIITSKAKMVTAGQTTCATAERRHGAGPTPPSEVLRLDSTTHSGSSEVAALLYPPSKTNRRIDEKKGEYWRESMVDGGVS